MRQLANASLVQLALIAETSEVGIVILLENLREAPMEFHEPMTNRYKVLAL